MIGKISEFKEQTKQKISKIIGKDGDQIEQQQYLEDNQLNILQDNQEQNEELQSSKKSPKKKFTSMVTDKYQKVSSMANSQYKNIKNEVKDKLNDIKVEIKSELNKVDEKFKEMLRGYKEKLNIWIRVKIQENILKVLESQQPKLKKKLKDPLMFQWVQDLVDDIVDEIYPELVEEIKYQLNLKIADPYVEVSTPLHFCLFKPYFWVRAWYLHTTNPYDQSFWWQVRTFSWWFLFLISAVPIFGVQAYFFVLAFFLLDKSDEFQLVNYIISFKKMQFLTLGCMKGVIGYGLYFYCATIYYDDGLQKDVALNTHDCFDKGPGISIDYIVDTISFLVAIALVWIAFIALYWSKPKGKAKFRYEQLGNTPEFETNLKSKCCCCSFSSSHGGRLKCFMIYEAFIGAISIGLYFVFYYAIFKDEQRIENQTKQVIFCIQTFYGLMSFPWLIFLIPSVQLLLTKSRATAYDSKGNCVPSNKNIKIIQKSQDLEAQNLLFEIDLGESIA